LSEKADPSPATNTGDKGSAFSPEKRGEAVTMWTFEQRQEQSAAVDKLSATEAYKAQVWRKRFAIFLCLLAFAALAGWLAGKL
jgi:hypothetical protein